MNDLINSAHAYSVSDIFASEDRIKYVIPKYQREYVWKKEQVEYLINDIMDNHDGYFLGTILCVNKTTDMLDIKSLEIIDGQQRLTTISLIYAAIYKIISSLKNDDEDFIANKVNLRNKLVIKSKNNEIKLELSSQNNNYEDYKAILNEIGLLNIPEFTKPLNLGNRRLYKIYRSILALFSDMEEKNLIEYLNKINSALIVKIEVNNYSDAYTIFESLNNRGIPLSAIDLIKNKILSEIDKKNKKNLIDINIKQAFEIWKKVSENIENFNLQERFIRQYYNSFRYDPKIKVKNYPIATKSILIKIYENLIGRDPKFLLIDIVQKSNLYKNFINPDRNDEFYQELMDLQHVGAATSYILLLYLFTKFNNDKKFLKKVIKFLVKYFIRRNLTDFPATRDLDRIFIKLVDECEKKQFIDIDFIIDYLISSERFANIEKFKEKLLGDIYIDNSFMTRFILCKIEEMHMTVENKRDLWIKDNSNRYLWTIEHIFPEGENIPEDWINLIADGDSEKAKQIQKLWVHKLGNLTITAYNQRLSNFTFLRKRDRKDENGNYIGYKNRLYLNKNLENKNVWTVNDIIDRTKYLVKEALEIFKVKNEEIGEIKIDTNINDDSDFNSIYY